MESNEELAALIKEQVKDDRYGSRCYPEDFVTFSLNSSISQNMGDDNERSKFLSDDGYMGKPRSRNEWRCPIHGRSAGYIDTVGTPRCRACKRDQDFIRRRGRGAKPRVSSCTHGSEFRRTYPGRNKSYCRACKTIATKAYRQRLKNLQAEGYRVPQANATFEEREDVKRVGTYRR